MRNFLVCPDCMSDKFVMAKQLKAGATGGTIDTEVLTCLKCHRLATKRELYDHYVGLMEEEARKFTRKDAEEMTSAYKVSGGKEAPFPVQERYED